MDLAEATDLAGDVDRVWTRRVLRIGSVGQHYQALPGAKTLYHVDRGEGRVDKEIVS
jgi:hypothetical protein